MERQSYANLKFDWVIILLFLVIVGFGWLNILSASLSGELINYFDMNTPYGKQLVFILFSLVLILIVLSLEVKFYERFASIIYLLSLVSLLGLFVFGKNVNGATSWYAIGGLTIQPSEFAKFATALAIAKYISDIQTNISSFKDQLKAITIIAIPALLIILQNDAGSTLVYAAFFFVLFREGISYRYLYFILGAIVVAIGTLKLGVLPTLIGISIPLVLYHFLSKKKKKSILYPIAIIASCLVFAFSVQFFYGSVLKPHQKDRINLWMRLEKDPKKLEQMKKTFAYNLRESEKAISSGGFLGKGFLKGTRTTGKFVPQQHTDYIFSTVGEEWGFVGSVFVVVAFVLLIIRILYLAELQKSQFSRIYGYGLGAILFFHFVINIGMVMGLIPTVGIPLPFFSYGGSGLWSFTLLLFIFVKLDSNRVNEW